MSTAGRGILSHPASLVQQDPSHREDRSEKKTASAASRGLLPVPASRCHPRLTTEEPGKTCLSRAVVIKILLGAPVHRALSTVARMTATGGSERDGERQGAQQPGCLSPAGR